MFELAIAVIITYCLAAIILMAVASYFRKSGGEHSGGSSRLRTLALENADYTIYIGMPIDMPAVWDTVLEVTDSTLILEDDTVVPYSDVCAFAVAYANGQLVDAELNGLPLPPGTTGLSPSRKTTNDFLEASELVTGKDYIQIKYGKSSAHPRQSDHYSTTLTNISDEPIRVERFAGYSKTSTGWRLFTVTNNFYSAEEFQEWYGLKNVEWIMPGESVTDPNNYGARPVLWAYYCCSKSGKRFLAGESLK